MVLFDSIIRRHKNVTFNDFGFGRQFEPEACGWEDKKKYIDSLHS